MTRRPGQPPTTWTELGLLSREQIDVNRARWAVERLAKQARDLAARLERLEHPTTPSKKEPVP